MLLAQNDLRDFWSALDPSKPDLARNALLAFFPDLLTAYGDASALLGADWYDMLRDTPPAAARFQAVLASPARAEQAQGALRWAVGPLFEDDATAALSRLMGTTQRLVMQPGRDSIWTSAQRDPVRSGVARIPTGTSTCKFCIMLASRGAVYGSLDRAGAGNEFHDNCDCVPTVIRSRDDYPDGHSLEMFKRLYQEGSGVGRDIPQGGILDTTTP